MGIDVSVNGEVSFNDLHQQLLSTCVQSNPVTKRLSLLNVCSIYRRRKSKNQAHDGNPAIYALKHKHGYSISNQEIIRFLDSFYQILDKAICMAPFDVVAPLPSSHKVNSIFANRVRRRVERVEFYPDLFEKKSVQEVITDVEATLIDDEGLKIAAKKLCSKLSKSPPGTVFSMKELSDHRLRKAINPLKLRDATVDKYARVLLVDDLLASGSTMLGACALLNNELGIEDVRGMCIFSHLK